MATGGSRAKNTERREEILSSAARIFYTKGYHATTIEDVASDVGMLKGSLYYYIKSKEDLLYELLVSGIEKGDRLIVQRIAGIDDPVKKLRRALEAQIEYIISNQVRVGLFLHEFDSLSGRRQQRIRGIMRHYQERFVEMVRQGQSEGVFAAGDPWLMVNAMLGMCNWIYRWYTTDSRDPGGRSPDMATVQETFVGILMHGILRS